MGHAIPRPDYVWACAGVTIIQNNGGGAIFRVNNGFDGIVYNGVGDYTLDLGDDPIDDSVIGVKVTLRGGIFAEVTVVPGAVNADRFKRILIAQHGAPLAAPVDSDFDIEINQFSNQ